MTPPRAKDGAGSPSRAGEGGRGRGRSPLALPAEIDAWCLGASWPWPPKPFRRSLRCFLSAPLCSNLHPLVVSSPLPDRDRPTDRRCVLAPRRLSTDSGGRNAVPRLSNCGRRGWRARERERRLAACTRAEKGQTAGAEYVAGLYQRTRNCWNSLNQGFLGRICPAVNSLFCIEECE